VLTPNGRSQLPLACPDIVPDGCRSPQPDQRHARWPGVSS
jgi:hypothetical protein